MADSIEKKILANMKKILEEGLNWVKVVEAEEIRNAFTDFKETEIPAIQIYDRPGALIQHAKSLINVGWPVTIELILKSTREGKVQQADLFDKKKDIQNLMAQNVKLKTVDGGINGFLQLRYDSFETDLHTTPGYFAVIMDYTAMFSDDYPGCG